MPRIETWGKLPQRVREHLIERMHDRAIGLADLNELRVWIESSPEVPEGDWFRRRFCFQAKPQKVTLFRLPYPLRRANKKPGICGELAN